LKIEMIVMAVPKLFGEEILNLILLIVAANGLAQRVDKVSHFEEHPRSDQGYEQVAHEV